MQSASSTRAKRNSQNKSYGSMAGDDLQFRIDTSSSETGCGGDDDAIEGGENQSVEKLIKGSNSSHSFSGGINVNIEASDYDSSEDEACVIESEKEQTITLTSNDEENSSMNKDQTDPSINSKSSNTSTLVRSSISNALNMKHSTIWLGCEDGR
jgi:hypothetical protein